MIEGRKGLGIHFQRFQRGKRTKFVSLLITSTLEQKVIRNAN